MNELEIFFVQKDNIEQIKYLFLKWKIEKIYRWIYIKKWVSLDKIMKVYFLDIVYYIFWTFVLSASTALLCSPNSKHIFIRTKNQRIIKIKDYTIIANRYLPKEFNTEYKQIKNNIYIPSKEIILLESLSTIWLPQRRIKDIKEYIATNISAIDYDKLKAFSKMYKGFVGASKELFQIIWELKWTRKMKTNDEYLSLIKAWYKIDNKIIDRLKWLKTSLLWFELSETTDWINFYNQEEFNNYCFWESYYSNYIEWTKFLVKEAEEIIKTWIVKKRPQDSHYILDNYLFIKDLYKKIFLNPSLFLKAIETDDDFIKFITSIHKNITKNWLWDRAWKFKTEENMAWNHKFVSPWEVEWTLRYAFNMAKDIKWIWKIIFLKIAFLECHPFDDWNGRTSRILVNSFLIANHKEPLLVTARLRDLYIDSIRAVSTYNNYEKLKQMIRQIYKETCKIDFKIPIEKSSLNDDLESYEDRYNKSMENWFFF